MKKNKSTVSNYIFHAGHKHIYASLQCHEDCYAMYF